MSPESADNKVDETPNPDTPRMKHEVEEIIEREQETEQQPADSVTAETPQASEVPEWQSQMEKMNTELEQMRKNYTNLEQRYESSSEEGKRLHRELERYKSQDQYLRENYDLDPLLEGYQAPVAPEQKPLTQADLQQWSIEQEWKSAENMFFSDSNNKDVAGHYLLRDMVKRMLFDDNHQYLRYPDKTPAEAFAAAATEVRNLLGGERLRGNLRLRRRH